jgi:hypothetical protein
MHRQLFFVLLAFALAGCQKKPVPEQKQPPGAELAEVFARSAHAFRKTDQGAMSAEGPSHRVTVDRKGGFLFEIRKQEATKEPAPRLAFARPSIRRGSFTLDASEEQARAKDERVVELRRGAITEELTNGEQGIEQAWRFAAEPEGKGGLVIEIGVSGLPFAGAGEAGLDFRDPETGTLVRYGVARWIDATGIDRVLPLPAFEGGRIVLRVPEDVLEASAFPAVLDPLVSAPLELADAEITSSSSGYFESGDIAFDGHRFMAVYAIGGHVVARRIEPTGEALDGTGIDLGIGKNPVIAFDGAIK